MDPYWEGDGITLYVGDCRIVTEWTRADVLITDPPYGVNYATNYGGVFTGTRIAGDADDMIRDTALDMWGPSRPAAVFASWRSSRPPGDPHSMPLIFDKGDDIGMGDLSWPWRPSYELCWIYGKGWAGARSGAVLRHRVLPGNFTPRLHPTEKPVPLLESIISKAPDGVIADPFCGAGSTLIAARNCGRAAIGVELEERYARAAARRLAQTVLTTKGTA